MEANSTNTLGRRKASVLIVSLILLLVAAFGVLSLVRYINDSQLTAKRDRDYISAFYAAESGVERVVDFFNNPRNFTDDNPGVYSKNKMDAHPARYADTVAVAPNSYDLFEPYWTAVLTDEDGNIVFDQDNNPTVTGSTYFENVNENGNLAVSLTSKVPSFTMNMENITDVEFEINEDQPYSWVSRIEVQNPNDIADLADLIDATNSPVICKVIATGETSRGVTVSVESIITENRARGFDSPAAILSEQAVEFNGNFKVHWGELWGKSNIDLPSNWDVKVPIYDSSIDFQDRNGKAPIDKWFAMRTEEWILDSKGNYANGFTTGRKGGDPNFTKNTPSVNSDEYTKPFDKPGEIEDYKNMFQNQNLNWPEYPYEDWKEFVQEFDFPYFYTDPDGELWGEDEDTGQLVKKSYEEWFDSDPSDEDYWDLSKIIVFVDGVPQNDQGQTSSVVTGEFYPRDPAEPGTVDIELKLAGGGLHTRGVMLIAPSMKMTGQGKTVTADKLEDPDLGGGFFMPDDSAYKDSDKVEIFHHGLMWGYSAMDLGGNRTIYGSIHATDGYGQGGTPSVWYNARMQDGGWISLNRSRVNRDLWNITRVNEEGEEEENDG